MKFYKFISVILHPIVIPTIGILLFLLLNPSPISIQRQYILISIVFFATYIIPLTSLIVLKLLGYVESYQVHSIKERKIPLFIMLVIFSILGKLFVNISDFRELGLLFYGTVAALIVVYLLFVLKIKTSLHILSMSSAIAFVLIFTSANSVSALPIIAILFVLTGILASARLHLKAHTPLEIYLGFFLGFCSQFGLYYLL
ncbi:hypothetical protein GCM10011416_10380 [Polaribacter pacificus]|uniref:PAP2 superfamily protein n=1 Tax=Polaribacter pacificus TaxID=1775173 RepID=A0A917HY06_9FLAO|nr:hypothetical protein [Polaribacter pacificus]GGG94869.1 hypothetical protein GCM10011416_10380 [Polaribacter pacificus]